MILSDLLEETYFSLTVNKVRTGLTMLGIVIGIGSVIAMVSIGQGSQNSIESSIASIGSNLLIVQPGAISGPGAVVSQGRGTAQTLTLADANAITQQTTALAVAPAVTGRDQITATGMNTNTTVVGTVAAYAQVRNIQIQEGSFITDQNNTDLDKVAVLGPTAQADLFSTTTDPDPVGQTITINHIPFTVVGITVAQGGSGFSNVDDMIYIPLSTDQRYLEGASYISSISIEAPSQGSMTDLQNQVTTLLLQQHNISNPSLADFSVLNQSQIVSAASSVTNTLTILLAAIAGISLVVGGIGIMNMMLTSVTERTREIGLRKAIGAKSRDITMQFLTESVALTFSGGVIGVGFGWAAAFLVTQFAGIATSISLTSVLLAFGVSAVIGIVFGYYPARRAASLNPIEALRYE